MNSIDFSPEIYQAHRELSKWNEKFLKFMLDNPEGLRRSHFDTVVNHPVFNYYRLQPWPTFISRERKRELKIVCQKVFDLLKSIPERLFNYDPQRIGTWPATFGPFTVKGPALRAAAESPISSCTSRWPSGSGPPAG